MHEDIHINRIKHQFAKRNIRHDIPLIVNNTLNLIKIRLLCIVYMGFPVTLRNTFNKITKTKLPYMSTNSLVAPPWAVALLFHINVVNGSNQLCMQPVPARLCRTKRLQYSNWEMG